MQTFPAVYCAFMVVIIVGMATWKWKIPQKRAALPNLATVLGVLGTFIGILFGLFQFDVTDIDGSIPGLLESLKFAFITSVVGIIFAIILRFFIIPSKPPSATLDTLADILRSGFEKAGANALAENKNTAATLDKIADILSNGFEKVNENAAENAAALVKAVYSVQQTHENTAARLDTLSALLKNSFQEINANAAAVANAVTGEDGSTLLTQMRKIHNTFSEKQGELISKIDSVEQALVGEGESTLLTQMRDMSKTSSKKQDDLISKIDSVEQALVGEDGSTLLTQMREMSATSSKKQDELISEFKKFAEKTAENSSKALIEALENVIRDFNEKITEQFGDNFRHLNEAVGQLLTWQENYKGQVEAMVGQLQKSMEAMEMCEEAMIVVTEKSEAFAGVADKLEQTLGELSGRNEAMNAHLEALADLGERAKSAFPAIQRNIQQITNGLTSTANGFARSAGAALKSIENQADQLEKNQAQVNAQLKASLEGQQALMAENQKQVGAQIQETAAGFKSSVETSLAGMAGQREQIEENQKIVNAGIKQTAADFQKSVGASLDSMSQQRSQMQLFQQTVDAQIQEIVDGFKSAVEASLASMRDQRTMIESNQKAVIAAIQESANRFSASVERTLGGMRTEIVQIARTSGADLSKLTTELDKKLRKEFSISLNTLADQLASLSGKFVEDYGPLTDKLRDVVRMIEGLNDERPVAAS